MKTCTKCKIEKEASQFYADRRTPDGRAHQCRSCKREANAAVRAKHLDVGNCAKGCGVPAVSELYCQRCLDQMAKHRKTRAQQGSCFASVKCPHPRTADTRYCEAHREQARWDRLKYKFGISQNDFQQLFDAQNGKCPITGEALTLADDEDVPKLSIATVDHCHTSGQVRNLLSSRANLVLGLLNEDPELIRRVAENMLAYLEKWKALKAA